MENLHQFGIEFFFFFFCVLSVILYGFVCFKGNQFPGKSFAENNLTF